VRPCILFVDDEPAVLRSLMMSLFKDRRRWDLESVESGAAALEWLQQRRCDVIVSDMRMPAMTGEQLLDEVRRRYPAMVLILLTGYSDPEAIARLAPFLHARLAKPCPSAVLRDAIEGALVKIATGNAP
jgi:DNA-binding NtrC family response regulator